LTEDDDAVCVWDPASPKTPPLVLFSQKSFIESIAFGPDGEHVAVSNAPDSPDGHPAGISDTVRIWDLRQPKTPAVVLSAHAGRIRAIAFAANGTLFATTDDGQPERRPMNAIFSFNVDPGRYAVRVWDLREPGAPKIVFTGHQSYVKSIAFSPDSDRLASGSWDGTVRIWDLRQPDAAPVVIVGLQSKTRWGADSVLEETRLFHLAADRPVHRTLASWRRVCRLVHAIDA
jgi:WD40 repeat protein